MGVEEILVHVAGSSSVKDDQRFRAMAAAYEDFEPATRIPLSSGGVSPQRCSQARSSSPVIGTMFDGARDDHDGISSVAVLHTEDTLIPMPGASYRSSGPLESVVYVDDTQLAAAALESQLLTSSLMVSSTASSPLAQRPLKRQRTPLGSEPQIEAFYTPMSAEHGGSAEAISDPTTDSVEPTGPSWLELVTTSHETESDPPAPQGPLTPLGVTTATPDSISANPAASSEIASMPDMIIPPAPSPALLPAPTTHITAQLLQLADSMDLSVRFKPLSTSRDLRPSERGYWHIDPSIWSLDLQAEFWSYLVELIGSGAAGWGVSGYRESRGSNDAGSEGRDKQDADGKGTHSGIGIGVVRIYCWGEIVGHVYLLAFVASKSKIKQTKAQWIDADGEVVVQMP